MRQSVCTRTPLSVSARASVGSYREQVQMVTTQQDQIPGYQLLDPLGEGNQGSVWRARSEHDGCIVAVKMLLADEDGVADVARFRRELAILSELRDPGLPGGLHVIEKDGRPHALVMEYIKGTSLQNMLKMRRLSPREVRACMCELARVVGVLHARGVVHRDLKPANIVLRQGWDTGVVGSVVLVDLGIARGTTEYATAHTVAGFLIGCVPYLAPEYVLSAKSAPAASPSTDVFALGVLLWRLLFEVHPTGLPMRSELIDLVRVYMQGTMAEPSPQAVAEVERAVPGLLEVVRCAAAFSPAERYATASELHASLSLLGATTGQTQIYVEPVPVSYNVSLRQSPQACPADCGSQPTTIDVDFDEVDPDSSLAQPRLEKTVDYCVSDLLGPASEAIESGVASAPPSPLPYGLQDGAADDQPTTLIPAGGRAGYATPTPVAEGTSSRQANDGSTTLPSRTLQGSNERRKRMLVLAPIIIFFLVAGLIGVVLGVMGALRLCG